MDLAKIRDRLNRAQGREYWRSLEELAEDPCFQELLEREFPAGASEWGGSLSRRRFLRLMGASLALAGLTSCGSQPEGKIYPYTESPEHIVPGEPLFYATAMPLGGVAEGLLVESHMGRPTKIEGNPRHPGSLGAAGVFAQASILGLYDPERAKVARKRRAISTWVRFADEARAQAERLEASGGAGLRILTGAFSSPTLVAQIETVLREYPNARWHQHEPLETGNALEGARLAFGEAVSPKYDLGRAEVILSLDSDFLACGPGALRYAREFAAKRRVRPDKGEMNRLYVVEPTPSVTGSAADHRLPLPAAEVQDFALALAAALNTGAKAPSRALPPEAARWIPALARDLERNRGKSLIVAGEVQPPRVHALAHAMNASLDNAGRTVAYIPPVQARPPGGAGTLRELVQEMAVGRVEFLLIAGDNPAYDAPADIPFAQRLPGVKFSVRLGLHEDETSALCLWHLPEAHYLEAWSDARAYDGTLSIIQPLIRPLYGGRSVHEVIDLVFGSGRPGAEIIESHWRSQRPEGDFRRWWRVTLHEGLAEDSAFPAKAVSLRKDFAEEALTRRPAEGLEIVFRPDPSVWDGRFANNGWLQELPKPLTKLTWDNAAMLSPAAAERLGVATGDLIELGLGGKKLRAAAFVLPGQADGSVSITLGYGRKRSGRAGSWPGFDAYGLRTSSDPWFRAGLELRKTGESYPLAVTQGHHSIRGRGIIREATREEYRKRPDFVRAEGHSGGKLPSFYPEYPYPGHAWGMAIDLSACIGCNACAVACQAENNIPIVGKEQVSMGREMHWLRVDTYYSRDLRTPAFSHQPMLCVHCELAPCEVVCPVGATVHSSEGLNEMIYNRCVGTRYCSNNCPYKVRRFNFFQYADRQPPSLKLMRNPDVTVRARGVMEKCTYCVQRIERARIQAKLEDRPLRDGDIVTACQAACPAEAIVFGDINDPDSRVSQLKAEPRNYGVLAELNTRPRTTYLAKIMNPNPELGEARSHG